MYFKKIALITGLALSGITLSSVVAPANAAVFNLSFLDNSGTQVGSGQFIDSENSVPTCFATSTNPAACTGNPLGGGSEIYVTHVVSSFNATIAGSTWGNSSALWYADPANSQEPGSITGSQYGPTLQGSNVWTSSSQEQFQLTFTSATDTNAAGSFMAQVGSSVTPSGIIGGTFTATSVPEASTILGAITSLALLGTVSSRLKLRK